MSNGRVVAQTLRGFMATGGCVRRWSGIESPARYQRRAFSLHDGPEEKTENLTEDTTSQSSRHIQEQFIANNSQIRSTSSEPLLKTKLPSANSLPKRDRSPKDWVHAHPALNSLRLAVEGNQFQVEVEDAWKALRDVEDANLLDSVPTKSLMRYARGLFSHIFSSMVGDTEYRRDFQGYGTQLAFVLDLLELRRPIPEYDWSLDILRVGVFTSLHDIDNAMALFRRLARNESAVKDVLALRSLSILLGLVYQLRGLDGAIGLIMDSWSIFEAHIYHIRRGSEFMEKGARTAGNKLVEMVYELLDTIAEPLIWVFENAKHWERTQLDRLVHLFVKYLCRRHRPSEALKFFREVNGISPKDGKPIYMEQSELYRVVRGLVRQKNFDQASSVFSDLEPSEDQQSLDFKKYHQTALIFNAAVGNVDEVERNFSELERIGVVSRSDQQLLMHGYANAGSIEHLQSLWRRFNSDETQPVPLEHYGTMLYAYARKGSLMDVEHWFERIVNSGHKPDIQIFAQLLKAFTLGDDLDGVSLVLRNMKRAGIPPNNICYTIIIAHLAKRRDPISAERVMKQMHVERLAPDTIALNALMNAHVQSNSWKGVVRIFDFIESTRKKAGHEGYRVDVYNVMLKALVRIGAPFPIVASFWRGLQDAAVTPDQYTWALLVQSACDAKRMDVAEDIFNEMDRLEVEMNSRSHINAYVLTVIMTGFLRVHDRVKAKEVFDEMLRRGIKPLSVTYGKIIKAYALEASEASLQIAEDFVKEITQMIRDSEVPYSTKGGKAMDFEVIYRPLMNAYKDLRRPDEVERLYTAVLEQQGDPTATFLTLMLDAYRKAGNIIGVQHIWPQLFQRVSLDSKTDLLPVPVTDTVPESETDKQLRRVPLRQADLLCVPLSIYIDALSRNGLHTEIALVWEQARDAGFSFDPSNWNHLSIALVRAGEIERAFEVIERIILPRAAQVARHRFNTRNRHPDDVFVFRETSEGVNSTQRRFVDDSSTEGDARRRLGQDKAHKRGISSIDKLYRRRDRRMQSLSKKQDDEPVEFDFGEPLFRLMQLMPTWRVWAPFNETLSHLAWALQTLNAHFYIYPWYCKAPPRDEPYRDGSTPEEILKRIYSRFPRTVRIVHRAYRYIRPIRRRIPQIKTEYQNSLK